MLTIVVDIVDHLGIFENTMKLFRFHKCMWNTAKWYIHYQYTCNVHFSIFIWKTEAWRQSIPWLCYWSLEWISNLIPQLIMDVIIYPCWKGPPVSTPCNIHNRANSRLAPSQWEMSLQSNAISRWLGANLKSAQHKTKHTLTHCFLCHILNSSPPGQNGRHLADNLFRCIFVNEKFCILIKISLKFVPKHPIDNNPALV